MNFEKEIFLLKIDLIYGGNIQLSKNKKKKKKYSTDGLIKKSTQKWKEDKISIAGGSYFSQKRKKIWFMKKINLKT